MMMLRNLDVTTGFDPTDWKVEHLEVFVDWWKLLEIGRVVLQDIIQTDVVKPKEIANNIRRLEERIELAKQAVP